MKATIWKRGAGLFAALLLVGGASGLLTLGEAAETAARTEAGRPLEIREGYQTVAENAPFTLAVDTSEGALLSLIHISNAYAQ